MLQTVCAGSCWGTALGHTLGLACEGLPARKVATRIQPLDRYSFFLLAETGHFNCARIAEVA